MKHVICIICLIGSIATSHAEQNWPTPERLERWERLSENSTYHDLYVLMEEMQYLPNESWPDPLKQILLKMAITYQQMLKDIQEGRPVIVPEHIAADKSSETDFLLYDMVTWQKDPQFIFFFENFDLRGAAVEGLVGIGEPAFEAVIRAFDREGLRDPPF